MENKWEGGIKHRPSWDVYFMTQAFLASQRSIDESCAHGAVLVSKDNRILSLGYNGPLRGTSDDLFPQTRPEKYWMVIHAEMNAILNYHGSHSDLVDAKLYVTGVPCHNCLKTVIQKGIKTIFYGGVTASMIDEKEKQAYKMLEKVSGAVITQLQIKEEIKHLFKRCEIYVEERG